MGIKPPPKPPPEKPRCGGTGVIRTPGKHIWAQREHRPPIYDGDTDPCEGCVDCQSDDYPQEEEPKPEPEKKPWRPATMGELQQRFKGDLK